MRETGIYKIIGGITYFIPHSLPPTNPQFQLTPEIVSLAQEASFALGKLNGMSFRLPDAQRFIKAYVIKEALLSSAIEGIHTTLIDVFTAPLDGELKLDKNTQLVLNYMKAADAAVAMLKTENLPLTSRIILHAHELLLSSGEGEKASPGNFRKQSVRVGNLIPPPATEIPQLMTALENYINQPQELPTIIQAGLVHVHFETIHPFLDGNGRIGRLLIVLMLIQNDLLHAPIFYPSYYFKKYHMEYYQKLDTVRTQGDFEGWIVYYLKAIKESAQDAYERAREIENLEVELKQLVDTHPDFARVKETANLFLTILFSNPITTVPYTSDLLKKAYNTAQGILKLFTKHNIVTEIIVNKRNKQYRFDRYLQLLEKEF